MVLLVCICVYSVHLSLFIETELSIVCNGVGIFVIQLICPAIWTGKIMREYYVDIKYQTNYTLRSGIYLLFVAARFS